MRLVHLLSAVITLALAAVILAPSSRTGLAQPPQGNPTRTPTSSSAAAELEPEAVTSLPYIQQEDNNEPDRTELILWTLAASGVAAVLAIIGYFIRLRIGFWPHRPPPREGGAPEDHH